MNIGSVKLTNQVILAPMAGVTDLPFRLLCKELGCGLVYSEMVSDKGLIYQNCHTVNMLRSHAAERPVAVQIFGSQPDLMAQAAQLIVNAQAADIIDINMGCPTPKIIKNGEGSALMRRPELAYEIIKQVAAAVTVPVTVKIRKGWDDKSVNAVEMAVLAEQAGAAAIAVHGRTREQFYAGQADWTVIRQVKAAVSIPVIGNGDIRYAADAARMLAETGCDAVMIGRGSQGNPWIFQQVSHYLQTGELLPEPSLRERLEVLFRHFEMLVEHKGEYVGVREMRRHAAWYTRGLPHSADLRMKLNAAECQQDFSNILQRAALWPDVGEGGRMEDE